MSAHTDERFRRQILLAIQYDNVTYGTIEEERQTVCQVKCGCKIGS